MLKKYFRRTVAVPGDHGSWVFLFSPLLIGLFAGWRAGEKPWQPATVFLILGAVAAFLIRQPVTIAVKVYSGRRPRSDLEAARFWIIVYAVFGILALVGLSWQGYASLLILAAPGIPVFAWHLWLVSRRAERRQAGVEIVATGVLALAAPAAYWIGKGSPELGGWILFLLVWLQSAASIVYAYLRLSQRDLPALPPMRERLRLGWRALLYTSFNLVAAAGLGLSGIVSGWLWAPFALQWLETLYGSLLRPAIGYKPTRIGLRQLFVSSLFTLLFILTW